MPSPTEITSAQLARLSGTPEAPVLIDLRIDADFDDDPRLIPAAFRHDFTDIEGGGRPAALLRHPGGKP
jgi:hypothetical protein